MEVLCDNSRSLKAELKDLRILEEFRAEMKKMGSVNRVVTTEENVIVVFTNSKTANAAASAETTFHGVKLKFQKHSRSRSRSSRKLRKDDKPKSRSLSKKRRSSLSNSLSAHRKGKVAERKLKSPQRDQAETPEEYHERKLREFGDLNRLDNKCRQELQKAGLATQQDVMEQGFFIPPNSGRSISEVVGSRIRTSIRARINGFAARAPQFKSHSPHRKRDSSSSSSGSSSSRKSSVSVSLSTCHSSPRNGKTVQLRVSNIPKLPSDKKPYLIALFSPFLSMLESAKGYPKPITRAKMKGDACILEVPNFALAESAQKILHNLPLMHSRLQVELLAGKFEEVAEEKRSNAKRGRKKEAKEPEKPPDVVDMMASKIESLQAMLLQATEEMRNMKAARA